MFSHMVQRYHSQTAPSQNMKDDTSSDIDVPDNKSCSRRVLILILIVTDQRYNCLSKTDTGEMKTKQTIKENHKNAQGFI